MDVQLTNENARDVFAGMFSFLLPIQKQMTIYYCLYL